jgi:hypothetical protein
MIQGQQLAAIVRAVIVMIAVLIVPTLAQAHGDQGYAAPQMKSVAPKKAISNGGMTLFRNGVVANAAVVASAPDMPFVPNGTCHDACCKTGNAGCSTVAAFNPPAAPPLPNIVSGIGLFSAGFQPGIDPETLLKPPKSVA